MTVKRSKLHSPEVTAAKFEKWRAEGKIPPQGQVPVNVAKTDPRVIVQSSVKKCDWLGEVVHEEPCTCGSSSKVAIHACQHDGMRRPSGSLGVCVPEEKNSKRIKDKDARRSIQCCESCPLRTISETQTAS